MNEFRLIWNTTFNNKLLKPKKPFSKFEAWVWMLMESCIKKDGDEESRNFGGKERMIRVEYGEFCHSERFMSEAWGWSRQRVSTFLKHLSSTLDPMIAQKVSQQISIVSICNFWEYQNPEKAKQASSKPAVSQQQASSKPNLNNKDLFLLKDGSSLKELFLSLNKKIHPKRLCIETNGHLSKIKARLKNFTGKEIIQAADNMLANPFMMGDNENNRKYATLEYLIRNNEHIRKWLEEAPGKISRLMKNLDVDNLED